MPASMAPFTVLLLVAAACFLRLVEATPLTVIAMRRDVVSPPVLAPNASTVWAVGDTQTVVWDTSNFPDQITNTNGVVLLGFLNDTTGNEHLMIDSPLASGFDIRSGTVDIVVPDVEPRTDYIIALLGDSGNISDKFTIKSSASGSASGTSTASTSAPMTSISQSSLSSESTLTLPAGSSSATATSSTGSTVAIESSSGTLAPATPSSSNSGTASTSQSTSQIAASAARPRMNLTRYITALVPILSLFVLA